MNNNIRHPIEFFPNQEAGLGRNCACIADGERSTLQNWFDLVWCDSKRGEADQRGRVADQTDE